MRSAFFAGTWTPHASGVIFLPSGAVRRGSVADIARWAHVIKEAKIPLQ